MSDGNGNGNTDTREEKITSLIQRLRGHADDVRSTDPAQADKLLTIAMIGEDQLDLSVSVHKQQVTHDATLAAAVLETARVLREQTEQTSNSLTTLLHEQSKAFLGGIESVRGDVGMLHVNVETLATSVRAVEKKVVINIALAAEAVMLAKGIAEDGDTKYDRVVDRVKDAEKNADLIRAALREQGGVVEAHGKVLAEIASPSATGHSSSSFPPALKTELLDGDDCGDTGVRQMIASSRADSVLAKVYESAQRDARASLEEERAQLRLEQAAARKVMEERFAQAVADSAAARAVLVSSSNEGIKEKSETREFKFKARHAILTAVLFLITTAGAAYVGVRGAQSPAPVSAPAHPEDNRAR